MNKSEMNIGEIRKRLACEVRVEDGQDPEVLIKKVLFEAFSSMFSSSIKRTTARRRNF